MPAGMVRETSLRAWTPLGYVLEMPRIRRAIDKVGPSSGGSAKVLYEIKYDDAPARSIANAPPRHRVSARLAPTSIRYPVFRTVRMYRGSAAFGSSLRRSSATCVSTVREYTSSE